MAAAEEALAAGYRRTDAVRNDVADFGVVYFVFVNDAAFLRLTNDRTRNRVREMFFKAGS